MTTAHVDISQFTNAPLRLSSEVSYAGFSADEVFDLLGDPKKITDWYPLAKSVLMHDDDPTGQAFDVEFTFFGRVSEKVLYWQPPNRYIYQAVGEQFPIKDYIAEIAIDAADDQRGTLIWSIYFNVVEGEEHQRILPVILPAINQAGMANLSRMLGGGDYAVRSFF